MKVDSTTNKFSYSSIMDADDDILSMAGVGLGLGGDDSSQHSGHRTERKSNKPVMEKRRRARINNCLNELKNILLEAMKKDPARHSKLEKADILELTVRHLQNIQRNQLAIAMATDPTVLHRFKNGFSECVTEVNRYMGRLDGADPGTRQRLLDHLGNCVNGLQQVGPTPFGSTGPVSSPYPGAVVGAPPPPPPPASFPGATTLPPAIAALGIHSAAAAIANLRHTTSSTTATHIPHSPLQQQQQHPFSAAADDLNNNFVRGGSLPHPHETSARLMSAFAAASALPRPRPPSPPVSPPPSLNISSSSHESSCTPSSLFQQSSSTPSSRNDSGLSDHSDICSSSVSRSSSSSNRTSGGGIGDPIDFSIGKVLNTSDSSGISSGMHVSSSTPVRVVKVEPMSSIPLPSPDESSMPPNKDMWRPW